MLPGRPEAVPKLFSMFATTPVVGEKDSSSQCPGVGASLKGVIELGIAGKNLNLSHLAKFNSLRLRAQFGLPT